MAGQELESDYLNDLLRMPPLYHLKLLKRQLKAAIRIRKMVSAIFSIKGVTYARLR
jgi:hypothetical protein